MNSSKSLGDIDHNYIAATSPEIFETIVIGSLSYSDLNNLGKTSKDMQLKVSSYDDIQSQLNALQPSYLRAFLAKQDNDNFAYFIMAGCHAGMVIGGYLNYETILSTYLGTVVGGVTGGAVSSAIAGYALDGIQGVKTGVSAYANLLNYTPFLKMVAKAQIAVLLPASCSKIIKKSYMELADEYIKNARASWSIFNVKNSEFNYNLQKNITEIKRQLSQPVIKKGI